MNVGHRVFHDAHIVLFETGCSRGVDFLRRHDLQSRYPHSEEKMYVSSASKKKDILRLKYNSDKENDTVTLCNPDLYEQRASFLEQAKKMSYSSLPPFQDF